MELTARLRNSTILENNFDVKEIIREIGDYRDLKKSAFVESFLVPESVNDEEATLRADSGLNSELQ